MMNIMNASVSTPERVAAVSGDLTPTERRIAEAVLAEPTLLAFGTVSGLAERIGTSRPTIVRFAHKLGFDGFTQLQRQARSELSHRLARPSERIRHDDETARPVRAALRGAIASVFEATDGERLNVLAAPLIHARNVWILSGESSRAGAHAVYSGLSMVRPGVRLLDEHAMGTDLSNAGDGDAAVVFDFFRYRRQVCTAAGLLADAGVAVVAITDNPLSPLVELTDTWCEIEIPAIGPFDSSVPAVAVAELLVARVARELHEQATDRIDRIEALWDAAEVFLN
jgi:DNA-binding MurR/RpiR family transcriptional regulator